MNNQKGSMVIFVIMVLFIASVGAGTYVYTNKNQKDSPTGDEVETVKEHDSFQEIDISNIPKRNTVNVSKDQGVGTQSGGATSVDADNGEKQNSKIVAPKTPQTPVTPMTADLKINGFDDIVYTTRASNINLSWGSGGVDNCQIVSNFPTSGIILHALWDLQAQGSQTVNTYNPDISFSNEDEAHWLIFKLECYKTNDPYNKVSDIVSVLLKPSFSKNITINSPTESVIYRGQQITIEWVSDEDNIPVVDIHLAMKNGEGSTTAAEIATDKKNEGGPIQWTVPNSLSKGNYQIVISEPTGGPEKGYATTNWFEIR